MWRELLDETNEDLRIIHKSKEREDEILVRAYAVRVVAYFAMQKEIFKNTNPAKNLCDLTAEYHTSWCAVADLRCFQRRSLDAY